ncbi:MAG: hypothetical protein IJ934_05145, partial [Acetobacter sp.]|nr:hypothetical protein [Acetobacter sp.]
GSNSQIHPKKTQKRYKNIPITYQAKKTTLNTLPAYPFPTTLLTCQRTTLQIPQQLNPIYTTSILMSTTFLTKNIKKPNHNPQNYNTTHTKKQIPTKLFFLTPKPLIRV